MLRPNTDAPKVVALRVTPVSADAICGDVRMPTKHQIVEACEMLGRTLRLGHLAGVLDMWASTPACTQGLRAARVFPVSVWPQALPHVDVVGNGCMTDTYHQLRKLKLVPDALVGVPPVCVLSRALSAAVPAAGSVTCLLVPQAILVDSRSPITKWLLPWHRKELVIVVKGATAAWSWLVVFASARTRRMIAPLLQDEVWGE